MEIIEKTKEKCKCVYDKCIDVAKKHPVLTSSLMAVLGGTTVYAFDSVKKHNEEAKATEEWNQWLSSADSDNLRTTDDILQKKWLHDGQPDNYLCSMRTDIDNELGKRWAKEHENDPAYNPNNHWTDECRWDKD